MKTLVETIEILNDAALMKGIERSRDDVKAGRVHQINDVSELDEIWA
jgi:PHD/YefM family antitoxin component YafN of YafNO toxin-antitoxin module